MYVMIAGLILLNYDKKDNIVVVFFKIDNWYFLNSFPLNVLFLVYYSEHEQCDQTIA